MSSCERRRDIFLKIEAVTGYSPLAPEPCSLRWGRDSMFNPMPGASTSSGKEEWCNLLQCLLDGKALSPEFEARLQREGINLAVVRSCVWAFCGG